MSDIYFEYDSISEYIDFSASGEKASTLLGDSDEGFLHAVNLLVKVDSRGNMVLDTFNSIEDYTSESSTAVLLFRSPDSKTDTILAKEKDDHIRKQKRSRLESIENRIASVQQDALIEVTRLRAEAEGILKDLTEH